MNKKKRPIAVAPCVTVLLLAGIWGEQLFYHEPSGDAEPYHQLIRTEAENMPYRVKDWVGSDIDVPPAAVALLRPNILLNRRFKNHRTGQYVSMLLVQCGDARDLLGHYPPVCYAANGWTESSAVEKDWNVNALTIQGMEYEFERSTFEKSARIYVGNFMVLPSGLTARDMTAVNTAAKDYRRKFFGAAQFQFVFPDDINADERNDIVRTFVDANWPILDAIRSGEKK